jgi:hypothetical protein
MVMSTQSSVAPESFEDVRLAIFRQHTRLAQVLDELEVEAEAVLAASGDGRAAPDGRALRMALDVVHASLLRHLADQESRFAPWLPRGGAALFGEHAEQRARTDALFHDRDVYGDARSLALEARAYVHAMRKQIAAEDDKLRAFG